MKLQGSIGIMFNEHHDIILNITIPKHYASAIGELKKDTQYDIEIKKHTEKRSLDANAYAWVLIGKLAKKLNIPSKEIYREYISHTGNYEIMPIKNEIVERWKEIWAAKGIGWVCDELGASKLQDYTNVRCYYGSSVYTTKEMAKLIDMIVTDCKDQGIETMSKSEIDRIVNEWRDYETIE